MKLTFPLGLIFLFTVTYLSSCMNCIDGTGDAIEESRALTEFDVLVVKGSMDCVIHQGNGQNKVIVTAQENLLPLINTEVDGSKLVIETEECFNTTEKLRVDVFCGELVRINHTGSGDLEGNGTVNFEDLKITSTGSGDLTLKLSGDELEISQTGSGDLELSGQAKFLELSMDGSGEIDAGELRVNEAEVEANGSGDLTIHVNESLELDANGSGDVNLKGKPKTQQTSMNGSGTLNHMD